ARCPSTGASRAMHSPAIAVTMPSHTCPLQAPGGALVPATALARYGPNTKVVINALNEARPQSQPAQATTRRRGTRSAATLRPVVVDTAVLFSISGGPLSPTARAAAAPYATGPVGR